MKPPIPPSRPAQHSGQRLRGLPYILVGLFLVYLGSCFLPPHEDTSFDVNGFAQLPVLNGGRIKPLDSIARSSLLILSGKQSVHLEDHTLSAIHWLMDVMYRPGIAISYPVFDIDNPDVLGAIGIQQTNQRRFPFADIEPKMNEIQKQDEQAEKVKPELRSRYQTAMVNLQANVILYEKLQNTLQPAGAENELAMLRDLEKKMSAAIQAHMKGPAKGNRALEPVLKEIERFRFLNDVAEFMALPLPRIPGEGGPRQWITIGNGVLLRINQDDYHPGVVAYAALGDAWRSGDPIAFNEALHEYQSWLHHLIPNDASRVGYEFIFNYVEPFYQSMLIYLTVFLVVFASWMVWPKTLNQSAYYLLILTFAVHTFGLVSRMVLQGRPPVTNLYSSAIFVGWVAVVLGIVLERMYRNGIGSMVASVIGFLTLIIAHHLAASGDTLEMMRAVLDSNFWLATHVTSVTVGYGATFLSGFLGTLYIFRRSFDPSWNEDTAVALERMVYGVVCFATLFSFVGTILGGIWADQSWGRFWGWDPKENGALMIVLWNVFILHARWGGYAKQRNLMILAVIGNIVTSLSWFGVNMLGIGLHSYGFMDKAFVWLIVFIIIQLAIIAFGLLSDRLPRRARPA